MSIQSLESLPNDIFQVLINGHFDSISIGRFLLLNRSIRHRVLDNGLVKKLYMDYPYETKSLYWIDPSLHKSLENFGYLHGHVKGGAHFHFENKHLYQLPPTLTSLILGGSLAEHCVYNIAPPSDTRASEEGSDSSIFDTPTPEKLIPGPIFSMIREYYDFYDEHYDYSTYRWKNEEAAKGYEPHILDPSLPFPFSQDDLDLLREQYFDFATRLPLLNNLVLRDTAPTQAVQCDACVCLYPANLESIWFHWNDTLTKLCTRYLPRYLKKIQLSSNKLFTVQCLPHLPPFLQVLHLPNLEIFTGYQLKAFPRTITDLDINFKGDGIHLNHLPPALTKLKLVSWAKGYSSNLPAHVKTLLFSDTLGSEVQSELADLVHVEELGCSHFTGSDVFSKLPKNLLVFGVSNAFKLSSTHDKGVALPPNLQKIWTTGQFNFGAAKTVTLIYNEGTTTYCLVEDHFDRPIIIEKRYIRY